jgi:hypothetical protein
MEQAKHSDRELLEAAAKAAGINLHVWGNPGDENFADMDALNYGRLWNPLKSDGDALRLAVKLNLDVDVCFSAVGVCYVFTNTAGDEDADHISEPTGDDPCAATRRAIVRAAASIHSRATGE